MKKRKYKESMIWSIVNGKEHPYSADKAIIDYMPIIDTLFPGINYYSISGFCDARERCAKPALSKMFPELTEKPASEIKKESSLEIEVFLPSDGYEHMGERWQIKFNNLL